MNERMKELTLGRRIAQLRRARGLTQELLAELDFRTMVQVIESGVTGRLLDLHDDGERLVIWTEYGGMLCEDTHLFAGTGR